MRWCGGHMIWCRRSLESITARSRLSGHTAAMSAEGHARNIAIITRKRAMWRNRKRATTTVLPTVIPMVTRMVTRTVIPTDIPTVIPMVIHMDIRTIMAMDIPMVTRRASTTRCYNEMFKYHMLSMDWLIKNVGSMLVCVWCLAVGWVDLQYLYKDSEQGDEWGRAHEYAIILFSIQIRDHFPFVLLLFVPFNFHILLITLRIQNPRIWVV